MSVPSVCECVNANLCCKVLWVVERLEKLCINALLRTNLNIVIFCFIFVLLEELFKLRTTFVEKVTGPLLSQLLDDIFNDGIVNDGEKDSIIEQNVSRADKARCLIDTVRRKGDEASRKMIAHIQRRDRFLYSQLGISCGLPASSGPCVSSCFHSN